MNTYRTEDLALAAYLFAVGFPCIELTENTARGNLFFSFPFNEQLPVAISLFSAIGDNVNAHEYYKSLKALKTLIYEHNRNHGRDIS